MAMEIEITVDCGADFVAQIFYTGEDSEPIGIQAPCRMDVKDMGGHTAMTLQTGVAAEDIPNQPTILIDGGQGFFQISIPRVLTANLTPGRYMFDLFATLRDPGPFTSQVVKVTSGWMQVNPSHTALIPAPVEG